MLRSHRRALQVLLYTHTPKSHLRKKTNKKQGSRKNKITSNSNEILIKIKY